MREIRTCRDYRPSQKVIDLVKEEDRRCSTNAHLPFANASQILDLIRTVQHSTRTLAAALSASEPMVSRCLAALRLSKSRVGRDKRGVSCVVHKPRAVTVAQK